SRSIRSFCMFRNRLNLKIVSLLALTLLLGLGARVVWKRYFSHPGKDFFNVTTFTAGVNYPWANYGNDFGVSPWGSIGVSIPDTKKFVEADFAYLHSQGITVIRWFLFCDMRSGIVFNPDGTVAGMDDHVMDDMSAAIEVAKKNDIKIIFVLFDFSAFSKGK